MKIGIMTWYSYYNYGTYLQATALSKLLESHQHEVDFINYDPASADHSQYAENKKTITDLWKKVVWKINNMQGNYNQVPEFAGTKFDEYAREYFKESKQCKTMEDLRSLNMTYDAFICGSDQIWSPLCFDPHYYLDFVDDKKKIAYAPSMGVSEIKNKAVKEPIKDLLQRFSYLSIREDAGQRIIRDLTGRNVFNAVDPTLLLGPKEWDQILGLGEKKSDDYILAYFLGDRKDSWKAVREFVQKLRMQCKVIPVYPKDKKREGAIKEIVGPKEFVDLVKNAKYVCTDSFHGIAFSIIYQKNFCCFQRFHANDKENQNSRIFSILKKLGIQDRLYDRSGEEMYLGTINYEEINQSLNIWRDESLNYLWSSLGNVKER